MGCDSELCQVVQAWNTEVAVLLVWLKSAFALGSAISPHLPWITGALGGAFGFYKWWETRETEIFKRVEDLQARNAHRINSARNRLFETAIRPSAGHAGIPPYVAAVPLELTLERTGFAKLLTFKPRRHTIEASLAQTTSSLLSQHTSQTIALKATESLLSSAHLLRGCMDSAAAQNCANESERRLHSQRALHHFDDAIRLLPEEKVLDALELKGYELCSLNEFDAAGEIFEKMESGARLLPNVKERNVRLARTLKLKALARLQQKGGKKQIVEWLTDSLVELERCAPLEGRDLLDQAQMYELKANAQISMSQWSKAEDSLMEAVSAYDALARASNSKNQLVAWIRCQLGREKPNDLLLAAALAGLHRNQTELSRLQNRTKDKKNAKDQSPESIRKPIPSR